MEADANQVGDLVYCGDGFEFRRLFAVDLVAAGRERRPDEMNRSTFGFCEGLYPWHRSYARRPLARRPLSVIEDRLTHFRRDEITPLLKRL